MQTNFHENVLKMTYANMHDSKKLLMHTLYEKI